MKVVISQPMYFPWVGMFEQIRLADVYVHYGDVQFSKGSFTNRVQIKTAQGIKWLTVPLKDVSIGQAIDEVRINASVDWRRQHMDMLKQAYAGTLHLKDMLGLVDSVFQRQADSVGMYLNHQLFEDAGVRVEYMDYQKLPYEQLHCEFTPYVSILDLIANMGKEGIEVIRSGTIYWKEYLNHE